MSRSSRRREGVAGEMAARMLLATWRAGGLAGCVRKLSAAIRMALPVLVRGRRTAASVAAYFDLITDEGRLFYGDSFHFGYFRSGRDVGIARGDARALDFPDASFDAIVCLEAAGDICVTEEDKDRLVRELHRVLRPGGHVGFSDLALRACPSAE